MQLHPEVQHAPLDLGRLQLDLGTHIGREFALVVQGHGVVHVNLHDVDLGVQLRHPELGVLHFRQGLAEYLAFHHEAASQIEGHAGIGDRPGTGDQALLGQALHQIEKTLAGLAEHVFPGHLDVIEKQLRRVLGVHPHLVQVATALEALHAPLHHQQCQGIGVVFRVGFRGDDDDIGIDAVGDVGLGAIEQEVVAHVPGGAAHAGQVAAGVRLGHGHREYGVAAHAAGQKTLPLLLVAKLLEVGAHQAAVQGIEPLPATGATGLLHDDLLIAEIAVAHAAVFLVRPDHQETLLAGFAEYLPVDDALLAKTGHMRLHLALQELAIRIAEHLLFFGKLSHNTIPWLF